jgi:hypothetical protein
MYQSDIIVDVCLLLLIAILAPFYIYLKKNKNKW